MTRAHIAFINFPHPPHVNPTLPIVSVLARRGYRVSYATSQRFASQVAEAGAEVVPCSPFVTPFAGSEWKSSGLELRRPFIVDLAERMLAEVFPFYERCRPNLVIYDFMALAGRILAHRMGIRAIQTSPTFARERADLNTFIETSVDAADQEWARNHYAELRKFLAQHQLFDDGVPFHERLNLHLFPRLFQPEGLVFGHQFFYAGRCAGEQQPWGQWSSAPAGATPIVLLGTSTTYVQGPEYFRTCLSALDGIDCRVVIFAGDKFDTESLRPLPSHCEVVRNVSQVRLFRDARLLICHGGIITPAEAAYYGVPLLMTTHGFPELEMQADIFEKLGLGVHLRKQATTVESVRRHAVALLTDSSVRARVEEIRRSVVREFGAEETVNRIEEYLFE